jgi:polysaccharide pyruvyl transferase WcaK-like protein
VRIHLGHHFYGAGNLGDDFMLAGFLAALRPLAPDATFTSCVPFPLEPLRARFPQVTWLPYTRPERERCIADCDTWLGLGGSPFQHALSRWFLDHLVTEADLCARAGKRMFFLGVGVQGPDELRSPDVQRIAAQAAGIWTRDAGSAEMLRSLSSKPPIASAADLAHLFFRAVRPPPAARGRLTVVPNFDYATWAGQEAFLRATAADRFATHVWLAQENRELPGAERALFAALPATEKSRWQLVAPDMPGTPLTAALAQWPSGEWLVTARYHAALAGAWAGSRIVVIVTNQKLRAAARELNCPVLQPDSDAAAVTRALDAAQPAIPPASLSQAAYDACAGFVRAAAR